MNQNYNYQQFSILFVDDEAQAGENFKDYLSDTFTIFTATTAEEGWNIFSQDPGRFAIVMTDQRMPGGSGVELLQKVRASRPRTIRILATAYSDLDAAIQAVNAGAIYKYITKPWDPPTLEVTLKRAMEFFLVQRERDLLLGEKMFALQRMMMTDRLVSLGIFAAGLNHHIRNSLTAVKTFLDLAPSKLKVENLNIDHLRNPDYWQDFYTTVQEQMQKVIQVLQDVKEIPEPPTIPLTDTISINQLVREALATKQPAFYARNLKVKLALGELSPVTGNTQMLRRALEFILQDEAINVGVNGTITITTSDHTVAEVKGILISIADDGPDIPLSVLHCVFDPFFVRRNLPQEYGLNLLTAFFLVYHHSGTVSVKSSNPGALFEVFIPLDPADIQLGSDEDHFLDRVFSTEKVWEKMLIQD